ASVRSTSLRLSSTNRIFLASMLRTSVLYQREIEGCAIVDPAFAPDAPTVALQDAAHRSQADPGALEFIFAVQTLEHTEQFVRVLHVESDAVIFDEDRDLVLVLLMHTDADHRFLAQARVLDGVGKEVDHGETKKVGIAGDCGQRRDLPPDLSPACVRH